MARCWCDFLTLALIAGRSIINKKGEGSQVKESTDSSTTIEDDDVKGKAPLTDAAHAIDYYQNHFSPTILYLLLGTPSWQFSFAPLITIAY